MHGLLTVLTDPATGDYTGVSAAITLDQMVDLAFIQFAGSASPGSGGLYTGGPLLAVQTGPQPVFKLSTGINFLGSAFLTADVAVSKGSDGGTVMAGHLTAAQPLVPFGTLGCDCTYTTHPGGDSEFAIGNWPEFALANIAVDIVNAIKALADTSADSACGTLADFVANNAFTGSFTVTPSVSLKRDATGINLAFALTGTYSLTLTLPGVSSPFVRPRPLPAFTVLIPVTTHMGGPARRARGRGANAATVFANDLLSDRTTIAMFLAMVVGQAATAVGLELVCDGLVDGSVPAPPGRPSGRSAALAARRPAGRSVRPGPPSRGGWPAVPRVRRPWPRRRQHRRHRVPAHPEIRPRVGHRDVGRGGGASGYTFEAAAARRHGAGRAEFRADPHRQPCCRPRSTPGRRLSGSG